MSLEGRKFTRRDLLKGAAALGAASMLPGDNMQDMRESLQKESERTPLERRFGERMEIGGNETEVIDIQPDTPTEKADILVAPGFNASIHTNSPILEMLSKEGRRVFSLNHPHSGRALREEASAPEQRAQFPTTELRKASNLLDLIEQKSPEKPIDCFAFSEGSLNAMLAAYLRPEKFNSIILSAPAGLIGEDSLWTIAGLSDEKKRGLAQRFSAQGAADATGKPSVDNFHSEFLELAAEEKEMFDYIASVWQEDEKTAKKHFVATAEDLWALSHMRIDDMIAFVRAAGVKIAVISGVDDRVFPTKTMAERIPADSLDGFISTIGAHGPHYSARSVNYLFDMLDAKREKEKAAAK